MMNRRETLQRLALLAGGTLAYSTLAGLMGGCRARPGAPRVQLSEEAFEALAALCERIIPETDTPGARAAGVPEFIDHMLKDWYYAAERIHFLDGLEAARRKARQMHGQDIPALPAEAQDALLGALQQESQNTPVREVVIDRTTGAIVERPDTYDEDLAAGRSPRRIRVVLRPFFRMLKELTVVGYYTSEVGAMANLKVSYMPGRFDLPGHYDGCIPYDEVGRPLL